MRDRNVSKAVRARPHRYAKRCGRVERKNVDKAKLAAKAREVFGRKTRRERKNGFIPAVVYGRAIKPKSLWIKTLDFSKLLKEAGESTIIKLKIDEEKERNALIYEIQKDPVSGQFIHADFFQVRMDEEIEKEVALIYVGEAPAVKELGGVFVQNLDEITVKCLPADLPAGIEVDISSLKTFADYIYAKDLKIPPKVKTDLNPATVVALVSAPRSEEELKGLDEKVEADVTKVEGVVKETPSVEGEEKGEEKKDGEKKEEEKK